MGKAREKRGPEEFTENPQLLESWKLNTGLLREREEGRAVRTEVGTGLWHDIGEKENQYLTIYVLCARHFTKEIISVVFSLPSQHSYLGGTSANFIDEETRVQNT